jgi:hypothetical protein
MRRLTHLLVLAAFIFSCGGQWAAFQAIAWANMIREYSEMVPLTQAVQMTFSGRYPCAICKAIAQERGAAEGTGPRQIRETVSAARRRNARAAESLRHVLA